MSDNIVKWVVGIIAALLIWWVMADFFENPSYYSEYDCPEYDYGNNPGVRGR